MAQFEIAGVEQRVGVGLQKELGRSKNVTGWEKHQVETAHRGHLAERDDMLFSFSRQTCLHQARGAFGNNDLVMRGDVIAVRVGNEGEWLRIPGIEPEILLRQENAALVTNIDHARCYAEGAAVSKPPLFACALTCYARTGFIVRVKRLVGLVALLFCASDAAHAADEAKILAKVDPLPVALSNDFEFRKTKLFSLGPATLAAAAARNKKENNGARAGNRATAAVAEAAINFETRYRLYGAVTALDGRERFGNYFDFFWLAKRDADITVRLEYRQEALRSFTQAREIHYPNARGHHKTEFAIIGDDFFDDGRVTAWRCLLVENGHIVAETKSYLWR